MMPAFSHFFLNRRRALSKDSPSFAATLAQRICDAGDSLEEFSERGRPYPDPAYPGFRELLVGPYRLVYEVVNLSKRWV